MKKYLILGIVAFIMIMPIAGASNLLSTNKTEVKTSMNVLNENFTHAVLVEYASTTTCPYCPTASGQLKSIYNSGDYDFYFVSLIGDANYLKIKSRLIELGVIYVPDVYFDGGYKQETGAQPDEQTYRTDIVQSGEREVPDIDIDVSVVWQGNSVLKISVTVQNNEAEEYEGHLRVYIVEPESRWNDANGNPNHFGVLAIPIDRSLAMPKGEVRPLGDTYTFSKTWRGYLNGFGDITQDNIMVIAAVFDKDTDYAVETAAAEPTAASEGLFQFISSRPIMLLFRLMREQGIISRLLQFS